MTLPVLKVEIDFASGPSFSYPLILDNAAFGILDTNSLGDAPADLVDISDMVMRCSTRRGRNRILSNFEVGTATVTINDPNSDFNPQNTSSPYYGKLIPLRKIRIYAETQFAGDTVQVNIFAGYITSYDTGFYSGVQQTSTVVLQCADGFRLLNNVSTGVSPVPGCPAGQLSGARVNALLDFGGFPTSMRSTNVGNSTMQADPGSARSILAAVQTVEQSEFGAFFMQRSGKTLFLDRDSVAKRADAVPRTIKDSVAVRSSFSTLVLRGSGFSAAVSKSVMIFKVASCLLAGSGQSSCFAQSAKKASSASSKPLACEIFCSRIEMFGSSAPSRTILPTFSGKNCA